MSHVRVVLMLTARVPDLRHRRDATVMVYAAGQCLNGLLAVQLVGKASRPERCLHFNLWRRAAVQTARGLAGERRLALGL